MSVPAPNASDEGIEPKEPVFALEVLSIGWERVWLTFQVSAVANEEAAAAIHNLSFEIVDAQRTFPVTATAAGASIFELRINITNFLERREIPNGTWRIRAVVDGEPDGVAAVAGSAETTLDDASRVFLFDQNRSAFTVSFGVAENDVGLEFLMRVFEFSRTPAGARRRGLRKRLTTSLTGVAAKRRYASWIYALFTRVPGPRRGNLLFASEQRSSIEGNLLRVHERLLERGIDGDFKIRHSYRLPNTTGWGATVRVLYLLATSEIVLIDDYFALLEHVKLDERTKIIQLWHAGSGFKAVGFSRFGQAGSPKLANPHRYYTYAITGSEHLRPVYAEAFGVEEEAIIATGLPRVDWFLDEARKAEFLNEFYAENPHLVGKRIILFAPTFRGRSIKSAYYDYELIDFEGLAKAIGPDAVVLFRMHHFVTEPVPIPAHLESQFFDFTKYSKGLELLHVTDLLITDYSSIIYEYSLLDRPMLFFAPDKTNYAATRGFHRDYDELAPGRVCLTFDEVLAAITDGDFEQDKVTKFRDENFDRVDTGSADRVIDWLILADPHPTVRRHRRQAADDDDNDSYAGTEHEDGDIDR